MKMPQCVFNEGGAGDSPDGTGQWPVPPTLNAYHVQWKFGQPAGCQPAIRQTASLRHGRSADWESAVSRTGSLLRWNRSERGIMLLEAMVYIALLFMVLGFAFSLFFKALSSSRELRAFTSDVSRVLDAGERWREDVRRATGRPELIQGSGEEIALRIPHGSHTIAYRFSGDTVWRDVEGQTATPFLSGVKMSRMNEDQREKVVSWRWEIELQTRRGKARVRPLFTFQATAAVEVPNHPDE